MKSVSLFLALFALSFTAQAGQVSYKTEEDFRGFVQSFEDYSNEYEEIEVIYNDLGKTEREEILSHAKESSDVWVDTVLEGPYQVNWKADLVIYGVTVYYNSKGELAAYYVSFGQQAWFTDDCEVPEEDGEPEEMFKECGAGDIVGHIFVSPDLKWSADDWNNPADFQD